MPDVPGTPRPAESPAARARGPLVAWGTLGLGAILSLAVYVAGSPTLDAPWVLGDEHIFIVRNPEVTGEGLPHDSPGQRLKLIFRLPPVEDLYQPLPVLTYAVQWAVSGGSVLALRRADVLLHALNALLLWRVLHRLLARGAAGRTPPLLTALSWGLALIWALHPVLASTYAADMGRTHLLSATFALLSLALHLRALEPGRGAWFAGALLALLAAMLCKPVLGWVVVVAAVEVSRLGWRATFRAPRVYVVGLICLGFAALTYWTSTRAGLVQEAAAGLFGDPVARSALAVWIYLRNLVAPLWLSWWYLPDPNTRWTYPLVWVGLLLAAASLVHALRAWRRPEQRGVTVGWAWCWAGLLPVIGLVGAREAAATDRYLYQPLMGIMLVIGTVLARRLSTGEQRRQLATKRFIWIGAAVLGAALLLRDWSYVRIYRSTLERGQLVAQLNPGDPRALEALAVAYSFAANHAAPADDLSEVPTGQQPGPFFLERCVSTLRQAAAVQNLAHYFPGVADRASFHRRLSFTFKGADDYADSLAQAQEALRLQPDAFLTWVRLAHAYHGLQHWKAAAEAYEQCQRLLPPDPQTRATHFTDFGYLLLFDLERPDLAYPQFEAAVATGCAPPLAYIGLARCEIRVGQGAAGYEIISRVLDADPTNALAALVLAEYHLRSNHWDEAAELYVTLVATYPDVYQRYDWYYEALRGFQSLCDQLGHWRDAALAWDQAVRLHPDRRELRSFRVWAVACADLPEARAWADELLREDPDNPLACLALALEELRDLHVPEALRWVRQARRGVPIARARALERGVVGLQKLAERGELPPEAALVEAVLYAAQGKVDEAREELREFTSDHPDSAWLALAEQLAEQISDCSLG